LLRSLREAGRGSRIGRSRLETHNALGVSLQRLESARFIEINNGVELLSQARFEIMTPAFPNDGAAAPQQGDEESWQ